MAQQCPWPVPACGHSTDTQQDSDRAARALRPCTLRRAGKRSVELGRAEVGRGRAIVPGRAAVLGVSSLQLCPQALPLQSQRRAEEQTLDTKVRAAPCFYSNAQRRSLLKVFVFQKKGRCPCRNARSSTAVLYKKQNNTRKRIRKSTNENMDKEEKRAEIVKSYILKVLEQKRESLLLLRSILIIIFLAWQKEIERF